uniref:Uncharacterized protein n=1 Tax=Aegilops tauschii subsp. strangulata TaxID=200361 RepID=A0A453NEA2_AEGTS
ASPLPRPPFPSAFTALQARNPPLQAAVSGAASGEERRGVDEGEEGADLHEALTKTRRLVECAMFASVAGLAYFLSNSLAIEQNYFSCFFPLPIVISSLRWGLEAGRKTMVATVLLLFTLSGPVKALTYLAAYAWSSWSIHGYYVEVGDQLDCFHHNLRNYTCSGSLWICVSDIVLDTRKYFSVDNR